MSHVFVAIRFITINVFYFLCNLQGISSVANNYEKRTTQSESNLCTAILGRHCFIFRVQTVFLIAHKYSDCEQKETIANTEISKYVY